MKPLSRIPAAFLVLLSLLLVTPTAHANVSHDARELPTTGSSRLVGGQSPGFDAFGKIKRPKFIGMVTADHAHKSGNEASGHVWWSLVSGSQDSLLLSSTLMAKTSIFGYSVMTSPTYKTVKPGGGRGKFAVARYSCKNSKSTKWYTFGQAYAPGTQKPHDFHEGKVQTLKCGVK